MTEKNLLFYDVRNGLDNTLVIMGLAKEMPLGYLKPFTSHASLEVGFTQSRLRVYFSM